MVMFRDGRTRFVKFWYIKWRVQVGANGYVKGWEKGEIRVESSGYRVEG